MPNGPKCYLVLDTGNRYSPSMTLRFIKTSPFKYLNSLIESTLQCGTGQYFLFISVHNYLNLLQEAVSEYDIDELLMGMASQITEREDNVITPDLRSKSCPTLPCSRELEHI